ncbi:MAG: carboxypeptidase regulatory-like domain-containing protein [Acidobacteriota bacterium]
MKFPVLRALRPVALVCAGVLCLTPASIAAETAQSIGGPSAPVAVRANAPISTRTAAVGVRGTSVVGTAWNPDNSPIPGARLRLRNVTTGKIEAASIADELGQFTFTDMEPGTYVIELVSDTGKLLSVGHPFTVSPGETVATFIRPGTKVPWFDGFFKNAAAAVAAAAAATGVTAIAPEKRTCVSACSGQ